MEIILFVLEAITYLIIKKLTNSVEVLLVFIQDLQNIEELDVLILQNLIILGNIAQRFKLLAQMK
jgi:hypothetical protein